MRGEPGPEDWGQWMGLHSIDDVMKPCIILCVCGLSFDPAKELVNVLESKQPYLAMRENANQASILGVLVFDSVKEMLAAFWLD